MQNEWDELMLETHTIKQHLDATRQELSQTLYQNDAACRVIARLVRERDEALAQLEAQRESVAAEVRVAAAVAGAGPEAMQEEPEVLAADGEAEIGFTQDILARMTAKFDQLSVTRKKRPIPSGLATRDEIGAFANSYSQTLHKTSPPGILCLALHPVRNGVLLTGGADKTCVVFDSASGKQLGVCQGHEKKVRSVAWHPTGAVAVSGSADHTCRIWAADDTAPTQYVELGRSDLHREEVVAVTIQATGDFFASASLDGSWALHDIQTARCIKRMSEAAGGGSLASASFHPDGLILATGAKTGIVHLWDLRQKGLCAATLEAHPAAAAALAFSENGYSLATGGEDGVAKIWDLRKIKDIASLPVGSEVKAISYDHSGVYLAAAGTNSVRVFVAKEKTQIAEFACTDRKPNTGIAFGPLAQYLVVSGMDRHVRIWGTRPSKE
ncbi:unnamed protein product [Phaeothamnion confervicola]